MSLQGRKTVSTKHFQILAFIKNHGVSGSFVPFSSVSLIMTTKINWTFWKDFKVQLGACRSNTTTIQISFQQLNKNFSFQFWQNCGRKYVRPTHNTPSSTLNNHENFLYSIALRHILSEIMCSIHWKWNNHLNKHFKMYPLLYHLIFNPTLKRREGNLGAKITIRFLHACTHVPLC
jgi:hypothetical protein